MGHAFFHCTVMVMQVCNLIADANFSGFVVSETANKFHNDEELPMDRLLVRRWHNRYEHKRSVLQTTSSA